MVLPSVNTLMKAMADADVNTSHRFYKLEGFTVNMLALVKNTYERKYVNF